MSTPAANVDSAASLNLPPAAAAAAAATWPEAPQESVEAADAADASRVAARRNAWNRPSNGGAAAADPGAVIDAAAWPALSESTRASPKSSSSESLKSLPESTAPAALPEQAAPIPAPPAKPAPTTLPGPAPIRQRSMKRGGGATNAPVANGGQVVAPPVSGDKPVPPVEIPGRDVPGKSGGTWEHGGKVSGFSPQGHGRNDHHRAYGGGHRKGGNSGGGVHHGGSNPRQDQDRRGYEWNSYSNFVGKNGPPMSPQQRPIPRTYFHSPMPGPAGFIGPPSPVRPYGPPVIYPEVAGPMMYPSSPIPHDALRGPMQFVPQPVVYLPPEHLNASALLKQIEYYFSNENLCRDIFLRQNMDDEGWVPVTLIANFNRVKRLTDNILFILDTVRASSVVEVQADKLRRRNDWSTWIIRPQASSAVNLQSSDPPAIDNLEGRMRRALVLAEVTGQSGTMATSRGIGGLPSGEFYNQSLMVGTPRGGGPSQHQ